MLCALAGLALLSSASACGGSASADPFVGTWQEAGSPLPTIVAKPGSAYVVTTWKGTWGHAERDGNALHIWAGAKPKTGYDFYLTYQPDSGKLLYTEPAGPGIHILYDKVSDSTAVPSPLPGAAGNAFSTP